MIAQRIPVLSGGFSLSRFMAQQEDGFWYDFTQTDRLFQETTGPTPANDPGEDIGLALSSRLWNGASLAAYVAGQPELVTNGDFATDLTGWSAAASTSPATVVWSAGAAVVDTSGGGTARFRSTVPTVAGRLYRISSTGTLAIAVGSSAGASDILGGAADLVRFFTATGTVTHLTCAETNNGRFIDNVSVREVSRYAATQATASFKPKYQTAGATGDGADDRLTLGYAAGSGENFLMLPKTTVPASLSATQVLAGGMDGSANGAYIAITTGGALRVKWGSTTLDSTGVDLRNGVRDLGLWTDNGTLYLYADGVVVGSGAWTGTIPTTTWNLFALNNNGTASNFLAGSLKAALAGREAINLARANQICAAY